MYRRIPRIALFTLFLAAMLAPPAHGASPSPGQQALAQAAAEQKYAFILFYKQNDAATQAVAKTLAQGIAERQDQALTVYVDVADAAEKDLVDKFKVARAPMPLTVAVAPNGAITGVYQQKLAAKHIDESFVTLATTRCMKSLQDGKFVLLCVHPTGKATTPGGVAEFQADPQFNARVALVSMRLDAPTEASFLDELEIDPATANGTTVVFMAPPGVMVGKYDAGVTMAKLAADLHAAGKCCEDENCKHNKKAK